MQTALVPRGELKNNDETTEAESEKERKRAQGTKGWKLGSISSDTLFSDKKPG